MIKQSQYATGGYETCLVHIDNFYNYLIIEVSGVRGVVPMSRWYS